MQVTVEKLQLPDWPVGQPVGHCLFDGRFVSTQLTVGRDIPRLYKKTEQAKKSKQVLLSGLCFIPATKFWPAAPLLTSLHDEL